VEDKTGQKTKLGGCQSWADVNAGVEDSSCWAEDNAGQMSKKAGWMSKLGGRHSRAEDKATWYPRQEASSARTWMGDQNTSRKTMCDNCTIAGRTIKLDGCQSGADVKAEQKTKLGGKKKKRQNKPGGSKASKTVDASSPCFHSN
jgi:hypothetical protein